jgi:hypothetical protein
VLVGEVGAHRVEARVHERLEEEVVSARPARVRAHRRAGYPGSALIREPELLELEPEPLELELEPVELEPEPLELEPEPLEVEPELLELEPDPTEGTDGD